MAFGSRSERKRDLGVVSSRWHLWRSELRRAVMRVRPEYFGWSPEQQERYGVSTPQQDLVALKQALLTELMRRKLTSREGAAAAPGCASGERCCWDRALLQLNGIGADEFCLDESLEDGRSILDFDTLRMFDEADYRLQEESRKSADADYEGKPYRGSLYLSSARMRLDGRFTNAMLSMAAGYVYAHLCDCSRELLEARIPYCYVRGRNHGKVHEGYWQWDMRVEAHGREGVVEELQRRIWEYERERFHALLTENDAQHRSCVYIVDESTPLRTRVHFVFGNKDTLAGIRFRSFVRDCRSMARPFAELANAVCREKALMAGFIDEQVADVTSAYDPKVARFRQVRKVALLARGVWQA